jgi:multidrug efflux pump
MSFTDVFIKRPVFATSLNLILLLVGIVSLYNLTVRLYPTIDASVVSVEITYNGANARLMEGFITTPVENAILGVDGVDYMTSKSVQSKTTITVNMKLGYDIDKALTNVSNKVNSVRWKLPSEIQDPVVSKTDPNQTPIVYLSFMSDAISLEAVSDYLLRVIQPQIQSLTGVSQAQIMSSREYAMRIWLDPKKMVAHNVTANDVYSALKGNNVQAASGQLKSKFHEYDVFATTDLNNAKEFNHLFIYNNNGHIIRIKDVGQAELGSTSYTASLYDIKGKMINFIGVVPKSNANPLEVSDAVEKIIPDLQAHLPPQIQMKVFWDNATFIRASLKEVQHTIIEASIIVFLVIFLMIGSFRAVLVPIITIPLSLIGVCIIMLALNYSINILTLLAFVLAIGLVVDDAIVVLENIHRHIDEGLHPFQAALVGTKEISFAVITMTITLAAVYAPIGFVTGLTGKLFSEFAFTLAGTVIVSGFIALTLSPMMCSKLYKANENTQAGFAGFVNKYFDVFKAGYKKSLIFVIRFWPVVVVVAVLIYASCILLYLHIPKELAPTEDDSFMVAITKGTAAANLQYTEQHTKILTDMIIHQPYIKDYVVINGYPYGENSSISLLVLTPTNKRKLSNVQIKNQLFPQLWSIPGVMAFPATTSPLPGTSGFTPIEFVLKTTTSYPDLYKANNKLMAAIRKWGKLTNVDTDLKIDKPETLVTIHRNKAADLGIPMNIISNSLNVFLGKPIINWFDYKGRAYQVLPRVYQKYRNKPSSLYNLYLRSASKKLIPLSDIATVTERVVPRSLNHFQGLHSATITAGLGPDIALGDALIYLKKLAEKTLPNNIQIDYAQQSRQYIQSAGKMIMVFGFAIIFIYLILAAQFESFKDPFIVMLSVPLSIAGALLFMLIFGATMNIYTEIGLITLIGLITKAGILIVEFANQQQEEGVPFKEAIIDASATRLRPILMTTLSMVLGVIPLAIATGAGAVSRRQIGITLIGGMSIGTLFSLYVVPTAYYLLATKKKLFKDQEG